MMVRPFSEVNSDFEQGDSTDVWHRFGVPWYDADPHPVFGSHTVQTVRQEHPEGDVLVYRSWCACGVTRMPGKDWENVRNPRVSASYQRAVANRVNTFQVLALGLLATTMFLSAGLSVYQGDELWSFIYGSLFALVTCGAVIVYRCRS